MPTKRRSSQSSIHLPLVSIIISNYNYEKYVAEAIESCFEQKYPSIEVIIVDDVSTDNSITVAKKALTNRPNGRIIRRLINGGQGSTLLDGFRESSGEFIAFLDADDVLFPDFVGTHIYTHLALPWQVAFTSSQLVHIGPDGRLITGSSGAIVRTFCSTPSEEDVHLLPIKIVPHVDRLLNKFANNITRCIYLPAHRAGYHWSSSSGLFFKRAAIEQIAYAELIRNVRLSADFYFTLTHLFNGSAIIDTRLGGYRIHGKNLYSQNAHLESVSHSHTVDPALFLNILNGFVECVTGPHLDHCAKLLSPDTYSSFLKTLQEYASHHVKPGTDSRIVAQAIISRFERVSAALGREYTIGLLSNNLGVTNEELKKFKSNQTDVVSNADSCV